MRDCVILSLLLYKCCETVMVEMSLLHRYRYTAARLCKMFRCQTWKNIMYMGTFYPGQVFGSFFLMDLMLWSKGASNAVPFTTLMALIGFGAPETFVFVSVLVCMC